MASERFSAVEKQGIFLGKASDALRGNVEVVLAAVHNNMRMAFPFIALDMRTPYFIREVVAESPGGSGARLIMERLKEQQSDRRSRGQPVDEVAESETVALALLDASKDNMAAVIPALDASLLADQEFILEAMESSGLGILAFEKGNFRNSLPFMREAFDVNTDVLDYASESDRSAGRLQVRGRRRSQAEELATDDGNRTTQADRRALQMRVCVSAAAGKQAGRESAGARSRSTEQPCPMQRSRQA
eukprot:scaffold7362_cov266-Pinguiococcus_pyrenoidosus.AAC.29